MGALQIRLNLHVLLLIAAFLMLCISVVPSKSFANEPENTEKAEKTETIRLAADVWCPYNCTPDSEYPGYMVEIAQRAFARHGIQISYENVPWARAIEDAKAGTFDGIIGAYYTDAPDFIFPSVPQGQCRNAFFVRLDSDWRYEGLSSLENKSVGIISDYAYSEQFDAYVEEHENDMNRIQKVFGNNATQNNIRKLILGRIDVMLEDHQVMGYILSQPEMEEYRNKFKKVDFLPDEEQDNGIIFIAFAPDNPNAQRYADILSDETKKMHESGEILDILNKYGITGLW
ncbi:MAG: substrate-binding periplasmic protein [Alphaproteobacteria bacterium]